jgi:hypothetical protein
MSGVTSAESCAFSKLTTRNAWITSPMAIFRAQFKHLAVRQGPKWGFLVRNDADLMSAWLTDLKDVRDGDVAQGRLAMPERNVDLDMLVLPPPLLVIILGVKAARNSAMPEVLLEALRMRQYHSKPTWVVDQPTYVFAPGHISFSENAHELIGEWARVKLNVKAKAVKAPALPEVPVAGIEPLDLSDDGQGDKGYGAPAHPTLSAPSPVQDGTVNMLGYDLTRKKKPKGRK